MRSSILKPWRRLRSLQGFSEAQARALWTRAQVDHNPMVEIVSLLPWGLCFTGGIQTVLYLGERSNWTDAA